MFYVFALFKVLLRYNYNKTIVSVAENPMLFEKVIELSEIILYRSKRVT